MQDVTLDGRSRIDALAVDKTELDQPTDRQLTLHLTAEERTLLLEAMALTQTQNPRAVIEVALRELVERQRFLNWVASHERADRVGSA